MPLHPQTVLKLRKEHDVDEHPYQPGHEAAHSNPASLQHCKVLADDSHVTLVEISEGTPRGFAFEPSGNHLAHVTSLLDRNLGNDASERAVAAWGCAIDAGKTREYHDAVYANRPKTEGDGYTDEQLIGFASTAGIEGAALDTFTKCFTDRTYLNWSANSTDIFYSSNVAGTPYALLNGVELPTATLVDQAALEKAVSDAAAGVTPSPASSPAAS